MKECESSSRGSRSVITRRIERIERGDKRTDETLKGDIFYYRNIFCSKK